MIAGRTASSTAATTQGTILETKEEFSAKGSQMNKRTKVAPRANGR
jgi:hypothetical protein